MSINKTKLKEMKSRIEQAMKHWKEMLFLADALIYEDVPLLLDEINRRNKGDENDRQRQK